MAQQQLAVGATHDETRRSPLQRVLGRDWNLSWLMVGPVVTIVLVLFIWLRLMMSLRRASQAADPRIARPGFHSHSS